MGGLYSLLAPITAFLVTAISAVGLRNEARTLPAPDDALYLPNGDALQTVSIGYKNVLADALWFNTISYFGKHFRTDRDYRWLFHMCDLVTTLDPGAKHVYRFGATMLVWEADKLDSSMKLLDKAIRNHPDDWIFFYLRGFQYMYFKKDYEKARDDFVAASKLPGVHPTVVQLAAKQLTDLNDVKAGEIFLRQMIQITDDPAARAALEEALRKLEAKGKRESKP